MWASIRPGRTVDLERSMTAASLGARLRISSHLADRLDPFAHDEDRPVGQHPTGTHVYQSARLDDSRLRRLAAVLGKSEAAGGHDHGEEQGESSSSHRESSRRSFSTPQGSRVPIAHQEPRSAIGDESLVQFRDYPVKGSSISSWPVISHRSIAVRNTESTLPHIVHHCGSRPMLISRP